MMQLFATIGAICTILLFTVSGNLWWLGGVLFILANLTFGAAMVFYNAYLPDIASEDQRDSVSSYGWAMGYLGGGLLLVANLALYLLNDKYGFMPGDLAIRINLASAGIWWLGFSFITWARVKPRHAVHVLPKGETYISIGFKQLGQTLREVKHFPETINRLLREQHALSDRFISHMLTRYSRTEGDLVDQLFNSTETRLAQALLLLARYGTRDQPQRVLRSISQQTLAEMVGTTRSRVNVLKNKFKRLGFIDSNRGTFTINNSLLTVVLRD